MNYQDLYDYLNQYFNYIKKIFLNEYSNFLDEQKINKIQNMTDIFRIHEDSKFKIYYDDKINICLDVEEFINENNLNNDADLKDIDINSKIYVKFLKDNVADKNRLVLSIILRPIISYILDLKEGAIENGIIDDITENISNKYNIKYEKPFDSKELIIVNLLKELLGNKVVYQGYLNNNYFELESILLSEYEIDFNEIKNTINNEYNIYSKRKNKVYYSDSLYDYQNLDYSKIIDLFDNLLLSKNKKNDFRKERVISVNKCIDNMIKHSILFDKDEQDRINYFSNIIKKYLNNLDDIESIYPNVKKIEEELRLLVGKMWSKQITNVVSFKEGSLFTFVVGEKNSGNVVKARLLSDVHLRNVTNKLKYNYGFIYKINNNIIYSSSNDFLVNETANNNENVIEFNGVHVEIDNQIDSTLMTPELLLRNDLKNKNHSKIILYNPIPIGVFVLYDNEFSIDYKKALELSSNYELPLIKINKNLYQNKNVNQKVETKQVEYKPKKRKIRKQTLSEKLKLIKNNLIYEEDESKTYN